MIVYFISIFDLPTAYCYASISPLSVNFTFLHTLNFCFLNILNFLLCQCSNINLCLKGERGMLKKALSLDVVTVCIVLSFSSPPPPQLHPFLGGGCGGSEEVCRFSWAPPPPMSGPPAELYLYVVGNLTNRRGVFCIFNTLHILVFLAGVFSCVSFVHFVGCGKNTKAVALLVSGPP